MKRLLNILLLGMLLLPVACGETTIDLSYCPPTDLYTFYTSEYDDLTDDPECLEQFEELALDYYQSIFAANPQFLATRFRVPVGLPSAKNYYVAQKFGYKNKNFSGNIHLGEDWNGNKGGNTDLGDPVYAIADGFVAFADDAGPGWHNVVVLIHKMNIRSNDYVISLYGHLNTMDVKPGMFVHSTNRIGTIGNARGRYIAHLHLEMRQDLLRPIGGGYAKKKIGFLHPRQFIKKHRKHNPAGSR